jgi:murein DD-endopeptidase MepM/ murein hydrolase activator NlpD
MRGRGILKLWPIFAALALCACIPRGADYRIHTVETPPPAPATEESPQVVPEQGVIAATPSWSAATVERNAQRVIDSVYIVQSGDTLYKIEAQSGVGLRQIVDANALVLPYTVKIGQRLTIPGGLYHRVARGETGIAISRAYGASWADIVTLNTIQPPYILREGQRLRLPDNVVMTSPGDVTPEDRAAAFSLNIDDVVTGGEPAVTRAGGPVTSVPPIIRPSSFAGGFAWPLNGTLLSRYGSKGAGKVNDGINIGGTLGTPVRASADGVVVYSGNEIGVFGGLVLIDHGSGWVTAYGHLGQLDVARGDMVTGGQAIGVVGDTGYVTQPQLHFEIRKDRKPVDPLIRLPIRG